MEALANKLKAQGRSTDVAASSAIFGSVGAMANTLVTADSRLKIGIWPIQSTSAPEAAMGIAALLGYLLKRWPSARVYQLLAWVEGEPEQYQWTISQSQFGVDDWELEGLDENVALWGSLEKNDDQWQLTLEIENDLAEAGDDQRTFSHAGASLSEIISWLPEASEAIANYLDTGETRLPAYEGHTWNEADLQSLLKQVFHWELNLYLSLWGRLWSDGQITADAQQLLQTSESLSDNLGAWVAANAIGHALHPMFSPVDEPLIALVPEVVATFVSSFPAVFLALPMHQLDYRAEAYDLMENNVEDYPEDALSWQTLADLYLQGGELAAAIDALQRGIEAGADSVDLYTSYGELLLLLDAQNITYGVGARQHTVGERSFVEGFILINPEETESDWLRWETAEAYRAALEIEPDNVDILYQLIILMIDLDNTQIWDDLARLIELDKEGDRVRNVVDALYGVEDVSPAIDLLRQAIADQPQRVDLRLSLASLYLTDFQPDAAQTELEITGKMTDDILVKSDIDRLLLSVDDPEFEARFGEIRDRIGAGHALSAADVEYLEEALEKAPNFAACYTLLASAYLAWDENDDALEVLLDGQKRFPENPDVLALLGRVLWDSGEKELALDYLNKGLKTNPNHVPLLITTGRYLFDDGHDEEARLFLTRAEALDPRHPMLIAAREHIARSLSSE